MKVRTECTIEKDELTEENYHKVIDDLKSANYKVSINTITGCITAVKEVTYEIDNDDEEDIITYFGE